MYPTTHPTRNEGMVHTLQQTWRGSNQGPTMFFLLQDAFAFPAPTAYSKSSFFDNLSCEATDKQARKDGAQNFSHKQQRELDVETFGSAGSERGR